MLSQARAICYTFWLIMHSDNAVSSTGFLLHILSIMHVDNIVSSAVYFFTHFWSIAMLKKISQSFRLQNVKINYLIQGPVQGRRHWGWNS